MTEKLSPKELAEETGITEDEAAEVLEHLIKEGWLFQKYITFNVRSEGSLELPDQ